MTLPHQKEEEEDEAFVGINEGEIADGDVLDDLNDEGERLQTVDSPRVIFKKSFNTCCLSIVSHASLILNANDTRLDLQMCRISRRAMVMTCQRMRATTRTERCLMMTRCTHSKATRVSVGLVSI